MKPAKIVGAIAAFGFAAMLGAVLWSAVKAHAAAEDIILQQRNVADDNYIQRTLPVPSQAAVFGWDPAGRIPMNWTFGSGFSAVGGVITATGAGTPTQSSASRSLNSAFQISSTRPAWVSYSVQITVTASIAGGQNGDIILEIASDSGFTANVQTVAVAGLGQTYTLAVALQGVQPQTTVVAGIVPASYWARLRTVNNIGTPAFLYRFGQEVLM